LSKITVFLAEMACVFSILSSDPCHATDLTGVVLDDQGQPVAGGSVTVARSSVDGPLRAAEAHPTATAADGTYSVKGLGAGPFIVCASKSGRALLDPCQWGSPAVVRLAGGTGSASTTTQLHLGAMVSIRVDDPAHLLYSAVPAGQPHPFLVMGVWPSDGLFRQALHVSSDATGHNFSLVVAPNVDLPFAVAVKNLVVADAATNIAIAANQRVNVNLAPGGTLQLHYTVTPSAVGSSNSTATANQ
jgi:hypothetical protein